ncbi:DUF1326 domain-containing protein [Desulfobacterota bacterium AH_259_B03_O07]|nr:DUF1326 domain-containing protein [Desulfobacterota bacterium AH_259_B03_O07]
MAYDFEGSLLEVCTCNILCPCWVAEDPDGDGTCDAAWGYRVDKGTIEGVDVSGVVFGTMNHIPGNVLDGNWRVVFFIDEKATEEQEEAVLNAFTGKLGGPLGDLANLVSEVIAVERVPITFDLVEGKGKLIIGEYVEAEMEPFRGPGGKTTTLVDSAFTTIPGSPAWLSKASNFQRKSSKYGLKDLDIQNHNAIQGDFRFTG